MERSTRRWREEKRLDRRLAPRDEEREGGGSDVTQMGWKRRTLSHSLI